MQTPAYPVCEDEILAEMVKSRECCRKAAKAFENIRGEMAARNIHGSDTRYLVAANRAATQMLSHLCRIPAGIESAMRSDDGRKYAARLVAEIGGILEKTMIMEREIRGQKVCGTLTG